MVARVLIANRGEVCSRISRACHELGLEAVAVYSDADRGAPWLHLADEVYYLGPSPAAESYLNVQRLLEIAERSDSDSIHPGYGFLAESPEFARAVERSGLTWVGPPPELIELMGDKRTAREAARSAGLPVIPGNSTAGTIESIKEFGDRHGFPVVVKAAYGGGGRGLRVIHDPEGLEAKVASAQREARGAFGRDELYVERYLPDARHIEVQVLADRHGNSTCVGDRDCTLQRKRQKVIEEAPAPGLTPAQRDELANWSLSLVRAIGYVSVGTVEFLYADGSFSFMEMNTRLQVEHAVTELVTGIDLVRWQLRIARGEVLESTDLPKPRGHAIEVRINAEDPNRDFSSSTGTISRWSMPSGPGVRVDVGAAHGWTVSPHYDSLLAKIVVHDENRESTRMRMLRALDETSVEGVETNLQLHRRLLESSDFGSCRFSTETIERLSATPVQSASAPSIRRGMNPVGRWLVEVEDKCLTVSVFEAMEAEDGRAESELQPRVSAGEGLNSTPVHHATAEEGRLVAPTAGVVAVVHAVKGERVEVGAPLIVIEAMKMETDVCADIAGIVDDVYVTPGSTVNAGDVLALVVGESRSGSHD